MPKLEDFDINNYNLAAAKIFGPNSLSGAKVEMYRLALKTWKEAVREIPGEKNREQD